MCAKVRNPANMKPSKPEDSEKKFYARESIWTPFFRCESNAPLLFGLVATYAALFSYYAIRMFWDPTKRDSELKEIFFWQYARLDIFFHLLIVAHLTPIILYPVLKLSWQYGNESILKSFKGILISFILISLMIGHLLYPWTLKFELSPLLATSIASEQMRIFFKMGILIYEKLTTHKNPDSMSFSKILYYLYAPTFIYRENYPRTKGINWTNVFINIGVFASHFIMLQLIIIDIFVPYFRLIGASDSWTGRDLAILTSVMFIFLPINMSSVTLTIFHCTQNIFAEILTFADREFYQDWWNSTSFTEQTRKNHTVMTDLLVFYFYKNYKRIFPGRSFLSFCLVLFTSYSCHDYIAKFGILLPPYYVVINALSLAWYARLKFRVWIRFGRFFVFMLICGVYTISSIYFGIEYYKRISNECSQLGFFGHFVPAILFC